MNEDALKQHVRAGEFEEGLAEILIEMRAIRHNQEILQLEMCWLRHALESLPTGIAIDEPLNIRWEDAP